MPDYYLPPTGGSTTLGGDVTGPSGSNTVGKIQNRNVSAAAPSDGYVLAWNAANNDWEPTVPSAILATGKVYEFENASSDIATYFQLRGNATGTEADLSVTINNASGKTLIKSFASQLGSPDVTYIPAGQWDFDFYRYASTTAGTTQLIFDVYIRTAGGSETLLFSATTADINDTVVTEGSLTYSYPTETYINATDRIVVKVSALVYSVSNITVHFVFDGATHPSHMHTPIADAAVTINGDVTGNTGNTTVVALRGKSLDSSLATIGISQDGYVLTWTNSANDWQAKKPTGGGGSIHNVTVTSTTISYAVQTSDYLIAVGTLGGAITITLPAGPSVGDRYEIKDASGTCSLTNTITITPAAGNIDGQATYVMATGYDAITVTYTGQWSVS